MKTACKFILPVIVFCITLLITLFGLGFLFQTDKKVDPIFLKVVGFWDPKVFNSLKKEFQEQNPQITIEYEQKDPKRYFPNLKADLVTIKTPDVFWWHSGWGPQLEKNLDPLPPETLSSASYEKTYYPVTKTDMAVKGTYRGMPLEIDGLALLYNKSIFASSNFTETPKTWTTLREKYVPSLTLRNEKQIFASAIALGSVVNVENYPEIVGLFLLQNGVVFTNKGALILYSQKKSKSNTAASEALRFFYLFSNTDKTWDNTQPNSIEAFAKGKTAMIILPAYKIHDLEAMVKKENLKLNFGVNPLPQLPGNQPVSWASYWALGVSNKSPEKAASWKLVKFLSGPESLRKVYRMETEMKGFGRAYPQMDMAKEQTTHPYLAAYLTQAPFAKSWFLNSDTFDNSLNDSVIAEFKKALARVEKGEGPGDALKKLVITLSPILKKYGIVTK